jgi:hypothetical protein
MIMGCYYPGVVGKIEVDRGVIVESPAAIIKAT